MDYVALDPPGSICQNAAIRELLNLRRPRRFMEVGVGSGGVARMLCKAGWQGCGVDSSAAAFARASQLLQPYINAGTFHLHHADVIDLVPHGDGADVVISMMVMEHQEDEPAFLRQLQRLAKPGGTLLIGVPARMDKWTIEDETVGHYRRYERQQLKKLLTTNGLHELAVWSVAVPVSNALLWASTRQVRAHSTPAGATKDDQTLMSGVRDIPFKTVFPFWCRVILNDYTMWPLCQLQRLFYGTNLGLTLIACGIVG